MKSKWAEFLFYAWALLCLAAYFVLFIIPKLQGKLE